MRAERSHIRTPQTLAALLACKVAGSPNRSQPHAHQPRGTRRGKTHLGVLVVEVVLLSGVVLQVEQLVAVGVSFRGKLARIYAVIALCGAPAGHLGVEEFIALQNNPADKKKNDKEIFYVMELQVARTRFSRRWPRGKAPTTEGIDSNVG